jgi:mono/diheme cytochrome c family protein
MLKEPFTGSLIIAISMKRIAIGIVALLGISLISMRSRPRQAAAAIQPIETPVQRGKAIYEQTCLPCHQADAGGVPGMTPPLRKSPYVQGAPAKLIGIILQGLNDRVEIDGDTYSNPMPPFGAVLNDEDIAAVLSYLRGHFGNKAAPISKPQVSKIRQYYSKTIKQQS